MRLRGSDYEVVRRLSIIMLVMVGTKRSMLAARRAMCLYDSMTSLLNPRNKSTKTVLGWSFSLGISHVRHYGHMLRRKGSAQCIYCNFFFKHWQRGELIPVPLIWKD